MAESPGCRAMRAVLRLQRSMAAVVEQELRDHYRLRLIDYQILKELQTDGVGPHLLGEVARQLFVHATTVSTACDRLAERALVTRGPHPTDRRAILIALTAEGTVVADAATDTLTRVNFGLGGLTPTQMTALTNTAGRVRSHRVTPD
jgi:DNA-binding MarR family transcriptional regulator